MAGTGKAKVELHMEQRQQQPPSMSSSSPLNGVKMADAPILFLVLSHNAFRKELEELHAVAVEAVESGSYDREVLRALGRRFEFFKLVFEYHCAAEDEILFAELDSTMKNTVSTYAQEHKSISSGLSSLLHCLDLVQKEGEDLSSLFPEILAYIESIKSMICQHMLEEERQVFPLILKQLPFKKQAKIIWKCICTVPVAVLQDFMPWMASFLPPDEQIDLLVGMKTVLPKEEVLQEVVISWLHNKKPSLAEASNEYGNGARGYSGQASFGNLLEIFPEAFHSGKKQRSVYSRSRKNPLDGIHILSSAITREFKQVLVELYQLRSSTTCSNLSSSLVQLQFLADILIFYSKALDQILYPILKGLSKNGLPFPHKRIIDECQVGNLQSFLCGKPQFGSQLSNFLEGLCEDVESLVVEISNLFICTDRKVSTGLSFMHENCSHKMQLWLLYAGLKSMPFGNLRSTAVWFSAALSDEQFKTMLDGVNVKCPSTYKSFSKLFHKWVRSRSSGGISLASSVKSAEHPPRAGYCKTVQIKADIGIIDSKLEIQDLNRLNPVDFVPNSTGSDNFRSWNASSSVSKMTEKLESGKFNLRRLFTQMLSSSYPTLKLPAEHGSFNNVFKIGSRPMNHLICFHNALIRDMKQIVSLSADLSRSFQKFFDFKRRFELIQILYDVHVDSESEAIFPALESKEKLNSIIHYCRVAHQLDAEQFKKISSVVDEISYFSENPVMMGQTNPTYFQLCIKLHEACSCMQKVISEHIRCGEVQLWSLFAEHFSIEEEEKIIGRILGRTRTETLIKMIPWLISLLKEDEWQGLISLWHKATKNTYFDEWLRDWGGGIINYYVPLDKEGSTVPLAFTADPVEMLLTYLEGQSGNIKGRCKSTEDNKVSEINFADHMSGQSRSLILHPQDPRNGEKHDKHHAPAKHSEEVDAKSSEKFVSSADQANKFRQDVEVPCQDQHILLNEKELESAIRRISSDPALEPQKKSHIMQSLLMSRWIVTQKKSKTMRAGCDKEEELGQQPSYRDDDKLIYGCKHYKRNCKLLAPCCNKLFACIRCHDDLTDHSVDRKTILKMMCMKCMVIQPISPRCSNPGCDDFCMAKYYCRICKLFDDDRQIYHCPYCNLCRLGKGLGIDYFHCMKCNACMSKTLSLHACREKCLEDNCPICHEYIFTSSSPVKALPCGHLMHSSCFQEYTFSNYTCPICSKSLGDMQVYFGMLDALLAEQKIPEEYSNQTQVILCNDCEARGVTPFHWIYHKCPRCGSYNTRLL